MIKITFRTNDLEKLADGIGDHKYPKGIGKRYRAVLGEIEEFTTIQDIRNRQGRDAKRKHGDRADQVGIHLNKGWRLMLKFPTDDGQEVLITLVREVSNHYE